LIDDTKVGPLFSLLVELHPPSNKNVIESASAVNWLIDFIAFVLLLI
jgi:hypothetical protein